MKKCEDCGTEMIPMVLPGSMFCPNDCDRKDAKERAKAKEDEDLFVPPNWGAMGLPSPAWWYPTQTVGTGSLFPGLMSNATTCSPWYGTTGSIDDEIDKIFDELDAKSSAMKVVSAKLGYETDFIYAPLRPLQIMKVDLTGYEDSVLERLAKNYRASALRTEYYGLLGMEDLDIEPIEHHETLGPTRPPRRDRS